MYQTVQNNLVHPESQNDHDTSALLTTMLWLLQQKLCKMQVLFDPYVSDMPKLPFDNFFRTS